MVGRFKTNKMDADDCESRTYIILKIHDKKCQRFQDDTYKNRVPRVKQGVLIIDPVVSKVYKSLSPCFSLEQKWNKIGITKEKWYKK